MLVFRLLFSATEKKLKDQINELEITIKKQSEELSLHVQKISDLEKENLDLVRASQDQNLVVENLYAKMLSLSSGADVVETEENSNMKEFAQKLKTMEDDYNRRLEDLKAEHEKEIEMLEFYYNSKIENADRKELEEYRISTEINNIHVEEQIELLIHEKQQLLEKLKSLSGVPLADSLAFEKMERSDVTVSNYLAAVLLVKNRTSRFISHWNLN